MSPESEGEKGTKTASRSGNIPPAGRPEGPFPVVLPQELADKIVDNLSSNVDLKSCSLVGRAWALHAQPKLFRHIILDPDGAEQWLYRTQRTITKMAPWIIKFELRADKDTDPSTIAWSTPSLLTRMIGSIAASKIQHLTITPFHMGRYRKNPLIRCFEPIANSLRSLELRFVGTSSSVVTFLLSMFPHLDDIFLEHIEPIYMSWARGGHEFEHAPSFAGTFEYVDLYGDIRAVLLSWITRFPLRFHTISPGMLMREDIPIFMKLLAMCAPTLREIPQILFDNDTWPFDLTNLFSSCTNLRRVGVGACDLKRMDSLGEVAFRSMRSRHISVIFVEITETLGTLRVDQAWNDEGWRSFEDLLCQLADERIDDGEPLVLELGIWRHPRLETYGPLDPGTILARFREKGLIRFTDHPPDPDYEAELQLRYSDGPITPAGLAALARLMGS